MSSRSQSPPVRWLFASLAALAGAGCAGAAAPPEGSSPAARPRPTSSVAVDVDRVEQHSWIWLRPSAPPSRCDGEQGAALDVWCQPLPAGAIARLGNSQAEPRRGPPSDFEADAAAEPPDTGAHPERILSVAITTDGMLVATSGSDGIRIWHAPSGKPLLRLRLPGESRGGAPAVAFVPGEHTLVAAGGGALRRYDLTSRQPLPPVPFAPLPPVSTAQAAAGTEGVASEDAGAPPGAMASEAPASDSEDRAEAAPVDVTVAADGDLVVVAMSQGLLRRFSLDRATELAPVAAVEPGPYGFVSNMTRPAVSADGSLIAVGHWKELLVLSGASAAPHLRVLSGWESVRDVDFAPQGSQLALLTEERLAVVDAATGKLVASQALRLGIHVGGAVRYDPTAPRILVFAEEQVVAFDAATAAPLGILTEGVDEGVYGRIALARTGRWVHPEGDHLMLVRQLPAASP